MDSGLPNNQTDSHDYITPLRLRLSQGGNNRYMRNISLLYKHGHVG